jgi:hypothetical protein
MPLAATEHTEGEVRRDRFGKYSLAMVTGAGLVAEIARTAGRAVFGAPPLNDGDPRGYRQSVFNNGYLVPSRNWNRSERARRWLPGKVSLSVHD